MLPPDEASIEEQDRDFTTAEIGLIAYFSSSLRHFGDMFVKYADDMEEHFYRLEDRSEQ